MSKNKNKFKKDFKLEENAVKEEQIAMAQAKQAEADKARQNKKKEKKAMKAKKQKANKKGLGATVKETFGELNKVAWPSFGKVVKTTGVVLSVVAIFTVVLLGIDLGLEQLHKLLIK